MVTARFLLGVVDLFDSYGEAIINNNNFASRERDALRDDVDRFANWSFEPFGPPSFSTLNRVNSSRRSTPQKTRFLPFPKISALSVE